MLQFRSPGRILVAVAAACAAASSTNALAWQRGSSSTVERAKRQLALLQKRHDKLKQDFADDLETTAKYCDANRIDNGAAALRKLAENVVNNPIRIHRLAREVQADLPRDIPAEQREWRIRFRKAREDYANGVYKLARDALNSGSGHPSFAYELVRETATYDSDHIAARRMLGFVRAGDKWVTPFEKKKAAAGEVWHDKYGWIPRSHVKQYDQGLEYYVPRGQKKGGWRRKEVVAQLRRDFRNAWTIRTQHFEVLTNHSREEGVRVAKTLEDYYEHFFHTFAGFFNSRQQMKELFAGAGRKAAPKRYTVHYYRTKDEYVQRLRTRIPQIAITNGLYLTNDRVAYFFHHPNVDNSPTLYHEATHQIFYESLPHNRTIAQREHFWIVEGISCYMESYSAKDGRVSLGDPKNQRFVAAKYRYVNDEFYVPLKQLSAMGMLEFQASKDIQKRYSQAAGMAKFFMEYDGGVYRDALIEHISQLYRGTRRVQTLEELTGVRYADLDRQYGKFIKDLPVNLRGAQVGQ